MGHQNILGQLERPQHSMELGMNLIKKRGNISTQGQPKGYTHTAAQLVKAPLMKGPPDQMNQEVVEYTRQGILKQFL